MMTTVDPLYEVLASTALGRLQRLATDQYVIAFGPNGRQFFATPNGYSATQLPTVVLNCLLTEPVRKVIWASYGSQPDSWFFAYELADGTSTFQLGAGVPPALRQFVKRIDPVEELRSALRVQLGNNGSFIAWSKTSWACHDIPSTLKTKLCQLSASHINKTGMTIGSSRGSLHQAAWHSDGSWYLVAHGRHWWKFRSSITIAAWNKLWSSTEPDPTPGELSELVLVALDPHAPVGETFCFIKKQHDAQEAPFVLHFIGDAMHATGVTDVAPAVHDTCLQHIQRKPEGPRFFRWAVSKRTGRPHPGDSWELSLTKGQKVKVWDDMGRNWYNVEGAGGVKGWVHGTWLSFCGSQVQRDARSTYAQFQDDMRKLLVPGQLRVFPSLREYMSECSNDACQPLRDDTQLGVCVHSLRTLLEGSGQYCHDWLKEERIIWHPDKFARYCHPEHKEELRTSAQEVFVLYGILMDVCKQHEKEQGP